MKPSDLRRHALGISLVAALLAGCGTAAPALVPGATVPAQAGGDWTIRSSFTSVYSFEDQPDGKEPRGGLAPSGDVLYGTTDLGGHGVGTVYTITPAGDESVIHRFGETEGAHPRGSLTALDGKLYGTASEAGPNSCGTIYDVSLPSGELKMLYGFNCIDGGRPNAGLTAAGETLYGTTILGGTGKHCGRFGCGTVFAFDPSSGKKHIVYSFDGGVDGSQPVASVIALHGTLYGTTEKGGRGCNEGCGTVFAVDPSSGKERIVYRFMGGKDGALPTAGLIAFENKLYGTTAVGGLYPRKCVAGCGTIFDVSPRAAARERVIYRFKGPEEGDGDGALPSSALIEVKGLLYGTTAGGGRRPYSSGHGTVFDVSPSGTEHVLHAFDGADGSRPQAPLVEMQGFLYGTTASGGDHCTPGGCGTVFKIAP